VAAVKAKRALWRTLALGGRGSTAFSFVRSVAVAALHHRDVTSPCSWPPPRRTSAAIMWPRATRSLAAGTLRVSAAAAPRPVPT
jgi:hypothetical protein